jgi:hypothetical protein
METRGQSSVDVSLALRTSEGENVMQFSSPDHPAAGQFGSENKANMLTLVLRLISPQGGGCNVW